MIITLTNADVLIGVIVGTIIGWPIGKLIAVIEEKLIGF